MSTPFGKALGSLLISDATSSSSIRCSRPGGNCLPFCSMIDLLPSRAAGRARFCRCVSGSLNCRPGLLSTCFPGKRATTATFDLGGVDFGWQSHLFFIRYAMSRPHSLCAALHTHTLDALLSRCRTGYNNGGSSRFVDVILSHYKPLILVVKI